MLNKNKFILACWAIMLMSSNIFAQKFWLTTDEFPGGLKIGITGSDEGSIFVACTDGILKTTDEGHTWQNLLHTSSLYSIYAANNGVILAGGSGKIFYSNNYGVSWDSVSLNVKYSVIGFKHTSNGNLFAITGGVDQNLGFVGAGVFVSENNGKSWTQRNNGLNNFLSCDHIAVDKHDNLYLTVQDELSENNGGLFISKDFGLNWEHINIKIDGKNIFSDDINVTYTLGLDISPADSIYISFQGVAVNVAVELNLSKSIYDLHSDNYWSVNNVSGSFSWWLGRILTGIYFAKNGDEYSSTYGSPAIGGTYFMKSGTKWERVLYGLGLDIQGLYNFQHFYENGCSKVFMVQNLDERVYWTDTSMTETSVDEINSKASFSVYPNPSHTNSKINIAFSDNAELKEITIIDLKGNEVLTATGTGSKVEIDSPKIPGVYFINYKNEIYKFLCF